MEGNIIEPDLQNSDNRPEPRTVERLNKPLTTRQERFCQSFVIYGSGAVAARAAGYKARSSNRQGWRLLQSVRVRERIREIQASLADHRGRANDVIIGKLEMVYHRAMENYQYHAAARAAQMQAKLFQGIEETRAELAAAGIGRDDEDRDRETPNNSPELAGPKMMTFDDNSREIDKACTQMSTWKKRV